MFTNAINTMNAFYPDLEQTNHVTQSLFGVYIVAN